MEGKYIFIFLLNDRKRGKVFFVCTSKRLKHIKKGLPPLNRFEILPNPNKEISRIKSPFRMPVLVDCDRLFVLSGISIPLTLLTNRRYICREYLEKILQIRKNNMRSEIVPLEIKSMISLNPLLNLKPKDSNLTLSS